MSCLEDSMDERMENAKVSRDIRRLKQMLWKRQDEATHHGLESISGVGLEFISEHLAVNAVE
eukprot:2531693-Karenia_brevis.AAC.1